MKYLSTGEFARLCRTRKDTLLFYDKEGLLKPRLVSENGYRRYSIGQFYEFDMVTMLKETGSSLKEIRAFMQEPDPAGLLTHLEEKKRLLHRERMRMAAREKMLEATIDFGHEALNARYDVLDLVEMPEERLEMTPVSEEDQATEEGSIEIFVKLFEKYEAQGRPVPMPLGVMMEKKKIASRSYLVDYFFCGASRETRRENLFIRPAGLYARFYHKGDTPNHADAYSRMVDDIERRGWVINGHVYGYDMASYIVSTNPMEYVAKYCVPVCVTENGEQGQAQRLAQGQAQEQAPGLSQGQE
ncbi:MAG: MerR family transcriptional regulator [Desulfovibrio sp.]|uniref:MerR family transcriptional regulator n=1 Tax=Desulfovibrio sp. TaxID=885 RepID=UPI002A371360|nr:MerR family transcriptional regulator [Desulfovibrio sp.]MDY0259218.1 MerR family transcriptional regulator [Desulfovibrio sp.]